MAESTLSITLWDLRREISRFLGYGTPYSTGTVAISTTTATLTGGVWPSWAGAANLVSKTDGSTVVSTARASDTTLTVPSSTWSSTAFELNPWTQEELDTINDILKEGYRRFLNPPLTQNRRRNREWSFLSPEAALNTVAPYATGTVTISSGVVTLSGGTFPGWAASGELTLGAGTYAGVPLEVASRDGNTQITLTDTSITDATARSYSLAQYVYDLPDDWAGNVTEEFTYPSGVSIAYRPVRIVAESQIRVLRQSNTWSGQPELAAIRPKAGTGTTGQRWEVLFYPHPDQAYTLNYRYRSNPNMMTAALPYPLGGMQFAGLLIESCLAVAEEKVNDVSNLHRAKFQELLMSAVDLDERRTSTFTLGRNRSFMDDDIESLEDRNEQLTLTYEFL